MAEKVARQTNYWWRPPDQPKTACLHSAKAGQLCPQCQQAALAYDSLFVLTCPRCGFTAEGGAFT